MEGEKEACASRAFRSCTASKLHSAVNPARISPKPRVHARQSKAEEQGEVRTEREREKENGTKQRSKVKQGGTRRNEQHPAKKRRRETKQNKINWTEEEMSEGKKKKEREMRGSANRSKAERNDAKLRVWIALRCVVLR